MANRAQLPDRSYRTYAFEGYERNELVYACINERASSASEPRMMIRQGNNWIKEGHRLLTLLERPNAFMDRYEFWSTIIMHHDIAGNAYALKVRSRSGQVVELWILRPDRVRIVPSVEKFIDHYEYLNGVGGDFIEIPANDVIHFKSAHPLNDYYGLAPLAAAGPRIDVDNYMRDFVKAFFRNAGVPSGILSTKNPMKRDQREEIIKRYTEDYSGPDGWHRMLLLDGADASFTSMTANLGPQGLVVPDLDAISEARICMIFGVPLTIVGARLGVNSSSYANKRSDRESFWDEEMAPFYRKLEGRLNLTLKPEFPDVDEIAFDLSDVQALQEDVDEIHQRVRQDVISGVMTIQEAREKVGYGDVPDVGTFLLPVNLVPVSADEVKAGNVREVSRGQPQGDETAATVPTVEVPAKDGS